MQITDREKFFNYFRMTPEVFEELLTLVGPRIQKEEVCRIPISARTRLQLTLRWLASGDSLASHSYAFRIACNTASKIVRETCTALWEVLKDKVFLQPTADNWQQVADEFQKICQFPNCIGSIDGKHIIIQAPLNSGSSCYNYKGNHSINLLAVSDANCCFSIVDIGAEGKRSDAGVFASSDLARLLDTKSLQLPSDRHLDNSGFKFPYVLVGDEAFPLTSATLFPPVSQSGGGLSWIGSTHN
ncbi:putative nuclease HARBI1 [Temnothorax longispinosus]|uniref:putative nuclease HARBI1 n=1 Tax=Temnothorax longispinosus TaxID=300112 RepID=UPI003A990D86